MSESSTSSTTTQSDSVHSKVSSTFKTDIVKEVLRNNFSNSKNKISDEAVDLIGELLKALVVEGSIRASKQANLENKNSVNLDHVETILPQLMLDFP